MITSGWVRPERRALVAVAVVGVGLCLRGPIVAVAPVLQDIQEDLAISAAAAGLLVSLPVLCFAGFSVLVPSLARRVGVHAAVIASLAVLALGTAVRPWWGFGVMIAGTLLIGAAITVGNVLLPAVVQRDFADRPGPLLSAFTASLIVSATAAAALTAALALRTGWRIAVAVWVLPVAVGGVLWMAAVWRRVGVRSRITGRTGRAPASSGLRAAAWREAATWELGAFFGLQSLLFNTVTSWLPTILGDESALDSRTAGTALSLFQVMGVVGALVVPVVSARRTGRFTAISAMTVSWVALFVGLLVAPSAWALWCTLGGVAQGGSLAIGFTLITMRSSGPEAARHLSAAVQTVGYCLGALGPVVIGALGDTAGGWTTPIAVMLALSVTWGVVGWRAASDAAIV